MTCHFTDCHQRQTFLDKISSILKTLCHPQCVNNSQTMFKKYLIYDDSVKFEKMCVPVIQNHSGEITNRLIA